MKSIIVIVSFLLVIWQSVKGSSDNLDSLDSVPSEFAYGFEPDFCNKYLWRGITYNEGFIMQPNIWLSYNDFTLAVWSNITLHDINDSIKRNEFDFSLSYSYSFMNLEIDNSFLYYIYPGQSDSPPTGELFFELSYPVGDFKLFTNFTIDVVEYLGAYYVEHGIEYENPLTSDLGISSSLSLGWASQKFNDTYVGVSKNTLSIISGNISLTYYPLDYLFIKPHMQLNKVVDKDLYPYLNKFSSHFGLAVGIEF